MHPALRASTQRLVKTAPLACWWQVYRVCRPSERYPSAMARCGQIAGGRLGRNEQAHDDLKAGQLPGHA